MPCCCSSSRNQKGMIECNIRDCTRTACPFVLDTLTTQTYLATFNILEALTLIFTSTFSWPSNCISMTGYELHQRGHKVNMLMTSGHSNGKLFPVNFEIFKLQVGQAKNFVATKKNLFFSSKKDMKIAAGWWMLFIGQMDHQTLSCLPSSNPMCGPKSSCRLVTNFRMSCCHQVCHIFRNIFHHS